MLHKSPLAALMQLCPAIPALRGNTLGDCVKDDVTLANLYAECAQRVKQWIDWAEMTQ